MKTILARYWVSRSTRERNMLKLVMLGSLIAAILLLKKGAVDWRDDMRVRHTVSEQTLKWMEKNRDLMSIKEDSGSCLSGLVSHLPEPITDTSVDGIRIIRTTFNGFSEMASVLTRPGLARINCPSILEVEWVNEKLQLSIESDYVH